MLHFFACLSSPVGMKFAGSGNLSLFQSKAIVYVHLSWEKTRFWMFLYWGVYCFRKKRKNETPLALKNLHVHWQVANEYKLPLDKTQNSENCVFLHDFIKSGDKLSNETPLTKKNSSLTGREILQILPADNKRDAES